MREERNIVREDAHTSVCVDDVFPKASEEPNPILKV